MIEKKSKFNTLMQGKEEGHELLITQTYFVQGREIQQLLTLNLCQLLLTFGCMNSISIHGKLYATSHQCLFLSFGKVNLIKTKR